MALGFNIFLRPTVGGICDFLQTSGRCRLGFLLNAMRHQPLHSTLTSEHAVRPRIINIAVALYLVNLVMFSAHGVIEVKSMDLPRSFEVIMYLSLCLLFATELFLVWLSAKGVNWARYLLAALVVLLSFGYLATSESLFEVYEYTHHTFFNWLSVAIQLACVTLLFGKQASLWFKKRPSIQNAA